MRTLTLSFLLIIGSVVLGPSPADAVAFKMKNDSRYTLRARCFDRGRWRPWVTFGPQGWGDFASSVKRREHSIEIDVLSQGRWQPLYRNHHGSRAFTRVVQAFNDSQGRIFLAWWDERPGCRGAPPYPGSNQSTCLKPSGWYKDWLKGQIIKYAVKIGMAYVLGG